MSDNKGAKELRDKMKRKQLSGAVVSRLTGVSSAHISYIMDGKKRPGRALGQLLKNIFGIEITDWDKEIK